MVNAGSAVSTNIPGIRWYQDKEEHIYSSVPPGGVLQKCKVYGKWILRKIIEIVPPYIMF